MTVHHDVMRVPCDRPDCRHVRNLLVQSVALTDLDAAQARIVELTTAATEAYKALRVEAMTEGLSHELDEAMDALREVLNPPTPSGLSEIVAASEALGLYDLDPVEDVIPLDLGPDGVED